MGMFFKEIFFHDCHPLVFGIAISPKLVFPILTDMDLLILLILATLKVISYEPVSISFIVYSNHSPSFIHPTLVPFPTSVVFSRSTP